MDSVNESVGLSERLFSQLESSTKNERHEVKLMMTNLISRLVGIHQVHAASCLCDRQTDIQTNTVEVTA